MAKFTDAYLLKCSFCAKSQKEVKLIAGPGVNVCNECLDGFNQIMVTAVPSWRWRRIGSPESPAASAGALEQIPFPGTRCCFCGRRRDQVEAVAGRFDITMCNECVDLASEYTFDEKDEWPWRATRPLLEPEEEQEAVNHLEEEDRLIRSLIEKVLIGEYDSHSLSSSELEFVHDVAADLITLGIDFSPGALALILDAYHAEIGAKLLVDRVAAGMTEEEIAHELQVSSKTVHQHLEDIRQKPHPPA
jgi:hypothetical protein